jgi:hypothetical protein
VRPETVVRWHRKGFAAYWRWKAHSRGGRPRIAKEVRDLIRRMSLENPLWGATKIYGELLKLGIEVAQSTASIYMVPRRGRPLQTWKTFIHNHAEGIASIDLFVVEQAPTVGPHWAAHGDARCREEPPSREALALQPNPCRRLLMRGISQADEAVLRRSAHPPRLSVRADMLARKPEIGTDFWSISVHGVEL